MRIYFKQELLGTIISTGTGMEFPSHVGRIIPAERIQALLKYVDWAQCQIDVDVYQPYDYELYEAEDPSYPRDNAKRFLLSDNWKIMQLIDKFLEYSRSMNKTTIATKELAEVPGLEEFARWWNCDYYKFNEEYLTAEDMTAYREFLFYENWRVEDDEGNEVPYFSYPIQFDTRDFGISWR